MVKKYEMDETNLDQIKTNKAAKGCSKHCGCKRDDEKERVFIIQFNDISEC